MFQIPKRTTTANRRRRRKVVIGGRRTCGPFERPGIPGIVASQFTLPRGADNVDGKQENADGLTERAQCSDEIKRVPTASSVIRKDATRHPEQAGEVLCIKRQMESDKEQPEVPQSQSTIE